MKYTQKKSSLSRLFNNEKKNVQVSRLMRNT